MLPPRFFIVWSSKLYQGLDLCIEDAIEGTQDAAAGATAAGGATAPGRPKIES